MNLWGHQISGIANTLAAIEQGYRRICLTSPTGAGKGRCISELAKNYVEAGRKVVVYTNRKLLVEQTSRVFAKAGMDHGVRSAGYGDNRGELLQVSSMQTEGARVLRKKRWKLHQADLVVCDECHLQVGKQARKVMDAHHQDGAVIVGTTATPLDLNGLYDHLVIAGTNSEVRACGAIVPAIHYGPDEPDLRHVGRFPLGEDPTQEQQKKAIMIQGIFGRVMDSWLKLNPEQKPTILFAPGVEESVWFAEQFCGAGIPWASIDGEDVWMRGKFYNASPKAREDVFEALNDGTIKGISNRFVLREGVDLPWVEVGILACVFGSLTSYIQSCGRLLRASPGKTHAIIQDHGGNWHRMGSINADRHWRLGDTAALLAGEREERLRGKKCRRCGAHCNTPICVKCGCVNETEPVRCPQCSRILTGFNCPCGYVIDPRRKSRPVIQQDGTLKEYEGDIFRPRLSMMKADTADVWKRVYFRAKNSGMTFRQAEGLFCHENGYYPPRTLPYMPMATGDFGGDFFKKVCDVPWDRLHHPEPKRVVENQGVLFQ